MSYPLDDTIAAVASPPGGGARGIVRISGPEMQTCLDRVFQAEDAANLSALTRPTAIGGSIRPGGGQRRLACELYLWPTRKSFTGQPVAEIHTLGSPPLLEGILNRLVSAGARLAERGEFTLRAFLNGRLDLTQAEAVLGAIDAASPPELDVALAQLAGGLAGPLHALRDALLELLAHLEAGFDFADEDLPFITPDRLSAELAAASEQIARLARQMESRREAADLVRVVLVGWPNTGKSSLFNALIHQAGALVSDLPATTRDYLTAQTDLDGATCLLIDTAGVEPRTGPGEEVRHAAQAASLRQRRAADLQILCLDSTRPLNAWERSELVQDPADRIVVLTKSDAPTRTDFTAPAVHTSSLTRQGIDDLTGELREAVLAARASGGDVVAGTAVRCGESLRLAAGCLDRARQIVHRDRGEEGEELVATEIRVALEALGRVVGAVYTDDVLETIFSRFCVGK